MVYRFETGRACGLPDCIMIKNHFKKTIKLTLTLTHLLYWSYNIADHVQYGRPRTIPAPKSIVSNRNKSVIAWKHKINKVLVYFTLMHVHNSNAFLRLSRQRGRVVNAPDWWSTWSRFKTHLRHSVVFLGKTLYGTFPCLVVLTSSSKLQ